MKKIIIALSAISFTFALQFVHGPTGWSFEQSQMQGMYFLSPVTIDGLAPTAGELDGSATNACAAGNCDVIAAFCNGNVVSWTYYAPDGSSIHTAGVMGDQQDGGFTTGYCLPGQVPTFQMYDQSNDEILAVTESGVWDTGGGFANNSFNNGVGLSASNTFGCTDATAFNYDATASAPCGSAGDPAGTTIANDCCLYGPSAVTVTATAGACEDEAGDDITLTWTATEGSGTVTYTLAGAEVTSPHTAADNGWSTTASFTITATSEYGSASGDGSAATCAEPTPLDAADLAATGGEGTIALSWTAPGAVAGGSDNHVDHYDIFIDGSDSGEDASAESYLHIVTSADESHEYAVRAVNSEGTAGPATSAVSGASSSMPGTTLDEIISGPGRLALSWAPDQATYAGQSLTYTLDGTNWVYTEEVSSTSRTLAGLEPEVEYCFTVTAHNTYGAGAASAAQCGTPTAGDQIEWGFRIYANINGFGQFDESDNFNYLGFSGTATDGYDSNFDIADFPSMPGNYLAFYFLHADWGVFWGDRFTQDVRLRQDEVHAHHGDDAEADLATFNAQLVSNMAGNATLTFELVDNTAEGDTPPLDAADANYNRVYAEYNGTHYPVGDGTVLSMFLEEGQPTDITFRIGNLEPQAPTGFLAVAQENDLTDGGEATTEIALSWDATDGCCGTLDGRYPPTDFTLYPLDCAAAPEAMGLGTSNTQAGLSFESLYSYEVTGTNNAGEGPTSSANATTDDNEDPTADACADCTTGYQSAHDGDPAATPLTVTLEGAAGDPENYALDVAWAQTSGDAVALTGADALTATYETGNAFDSADDRVHTFSFTSTDDDYPVGCDDTGLHSATDDVTIAIAAEPNQIQHQESQLILIMPVKLILSVQMLMAVLMMHVIMISYLHVKLELNSSAHNGRCLTMVTLVHQQLP